MEYIFKSRRSRQAALKSAALSPDMALSPGSQIINQLSGTPGGPGEYVLFTGPGTVSSETMTETYGVLTVGAVNSGTVTVGQEVTGARVLPLTAILGNLSGSGPGSTWLVNNAETVAGDLTMTAPPLQVQNQSFVGATEHSDFFDVEPNGDFGFDNNPSSLSCMSGTAAAALGLTQASGAINSIAGRPAPVGGQQFMNNLVQNETSQFGSFQSNGYPDLDQALTAWAQSTDGYQFLSRLLTAPRRQDRACRQPIQRAHGAVAERARRRRRRRGLIYRSPGRPRPQQKSPTLPVLTVWRARAPRRWRSPAIMSRHRA